MLLIPFFENLEGRLKRLLLRQCALLKLLSALCFNFQLIVRLCSELQHPVRKPLFFSLVKTKVPPVFFLANI